MKAVLGDLLLYTSVVFLTVLIHLYILCVFFDKKDIEAPTLDNSTTVMSIDIPDVGVKILTIDYKSEVLSIDDAAIPINIEWSLYNSMFCADIRPTESILLAEANGEQVWLEFCTGIFSPKDIGGEAIEFKLHFMNINEVDYPFHRMKPTEVGQHYDVYTIKINHINNITDERDK